MEFETRAIHEGQKPDKNTGAVIPPVYQTSTYCQESIGVHRGYEYSRTGNPTRDSLEKLLASLEGAEYGLAFASGVAATTAVFSLLEPGDHVVVGEDIYGGTYRLIEKVFFPWGIRASYASLDDMESFADAIKKETRLIWVESPTNPLLKIIDIVRLSSISKQKGIILAVDNTFATPYFQKPLALGADIVVHSTTKYLSGHSDIIGGGALTSSQKIYQKLKFYQNAAGAVPGPWDCWLAIRGIKTLAARMKEHAQNAMYLARYLESHPRVERIYYPGLSGSKYYKIACRQMSGFGAMISMELKGGYPAVESFFSRLNLFLLAESLGGVESLACYPAAMTHATFSKAQRQKRRISDNLVRLSVGIENRLDLKNDLQQALIH